MGLVFDIDPSHSVKGTMSVQQFNTCSFKYGFVHCAVNPRKQLWGRQQHFIV